MIEMIAFDADDTLWKTEANFEKAQRELQKLLSPWQDSEKTEEIVYETEMDNLSIYGLGVKAFTLSMIEAALKISQGEIQGESIEKIILLGREMLAAEVELLPFVEETIKALTKDYPLMVITKGDLLDQTTKISRSGLGAHFSLVEVVSDKSPHAYARVLKKFHIDPENIIMVGNSLKSDILPILKLGGRAVHIPASTTWAHERVENFDTSHENFHELEHMGHLPGLITEIA